MDQITRQPKWSGLILFILSFFIITLDSFVPSDAYSLPNKSPAIQPKDQEYVGFLFGNVFFFSEVIDLKLNNDFSFSLTSDLYLFPPPDYPTPVPAEGTYLHDNPPVIKAEGTTVIYYDTEFKQNTEIQYTLTGILLGFRGLLIVGWGTRKFTCYIDETSVIENIWSEDFIFFGSGF